MRRPILAPIAIMLIGVLAVSTCGCLGRKAAQPGQPQTPPAEQGTPGAGGGSTNVSIYLARWGGAPALEEVNRTVSPGDGTGEAAGEAALIKAALEALIAGPSDTEKSGGLSGTLPNSTKVRSVKVEGTIAIVDFSKEIITKASSEAAVSGTGESFALESIRKTVANSPKIERVKVLIEGKAKGQVDGRLVEDFWGHVGLPEHLIIRDSAKGAQAAGPGGPAEQTTGKPADGMAIKSVRWSSDASKFRLVIDIENSDGAAAPYCPAVKASLSASLRVISIDVNGVRTVKDTRLVAGKPLKIGAGVAKTITRDADEARGDDQCVALDLALDPAKSYTYKLFSLSNPVRVVIDVFPK